MGGRRMRQVFVSYARDDDEWKALVEEAVLRAGLRPWTDDRLVPGTRQWTGEIERAIKGSVALVVVLTPIAKASEWVANEVVYAQQHEVPVIPILAEGTATSSIPIGLITTQHVDLRQPGAVDLLVRELSRLAGPPAAARRSPVRSTAARAPVRSTSPVAPRPTIPALVPPPAPGPRPRSKPRTERGLTIRWTSWVVRAVGAALLRFGTWSLARVRAARERKPGPVPVPMVPVGPAPEVTGWGVADLVRGTRAGIADLWEGLQRSTSGLTARRRARGGERSRWGLLRARHLAFVIDAALMLVVTAMAMVGITIVLAQLWGEYGDDCPGSYSSPQCDADATVAAMGAWPWLVAIVVLAAGGQLLWGTTPGKMLMRLRVVGAEGGPPSTREVLVRTLLLPADVFIGTLVSAIDEEGRRFGDLIAGTRVETVVAEGWVGPVRQF